MTAVMTQMVVATLVVTKATSDLRLIVDCLIKHFLNLFLLLPLAGITIRSPFIFGHKQHVAHGALRWFIPRGVTVIIWLVVVVFLVELFFGIVTHDTILDHFVIPVSRGLFRQALLRLASKRQPN